MSRNQLIIGLANQQLANTIWDDLQHLTGATSALTISPPTLVVSATTNTIGASTSVVGFFGAAATAQPVVPNTSNTTTIANALLALGLVKSA